MFGTRSLHSFKTFQKHQILFFLFPKPLKSKHKGRKWLLKEFVSKSHSHHQVPLKSKPSSEGPSLHHKGGYCLSRIGFPYSYLQSVATLNEAGISLSYVQSVTSALAGLALQLRAGLTLWSRTGASCKPLCHLVTWYHGSAVLEWSSSCQIFSYSSFSSSFCG